MVAAFMIVVRRSFFRRCLWRQSILNFFLFRFCLDLSGVEVK